MIANILKSIFGDKTSKERKEYQPFIDKSNSFFEEYKSLTDDQLRSKTAEIKQQIGRAHV